MSYISLENLEAYKLSRKLSNNSWKVYQNLDWQLKKVIGDQMIRSIDSVGANIAEGYGRYHYLDKIRFYYNARGSLLEFKHWLDLFFERNIIKREEYNIFCNNYQQIAKLLNGLIRSNYKSKNL